MKKDKRRRKKKKRDEVRQWTDRGQREDKQRIASQLMEKREETHFL
jgi:hypothetical protein